MQNKHLEQIKQMCKSPSMEIAGNSYVVTGRMSEGVILDELMHLTNHRGHLRNKLQPVLRHPPPTKKASTLPYHSIRLDLGKPTYYSNTLPSSILSSSRYRQRCTHRRSRFQRPRHHPMVIRTPSSKKVATIHHSPQYLPGV
jgi:hypothetical protein